MAKQVSRIRSFPQVIKTPELLTAQELARALRLNPQTLYRLTRQGVIPAIRIGKSLRFDPAQIRMTFRTRVGPLRPPAEPFAFTRLDELLARNRWPTPPPDLVLKRFDVVFPPGIDLTALAYERMHP